MVKIVVPGDYSRYILTARDLANYLRSHFGEGYDFQIEVLTRLRVLFRAVGTLGLTTMDRIPMTCGISRAQAIFQTYVIDITSILTGFLG